VLQLPSDVLQQVLAKAAVSTSVAADVLMLYKVCREWSVRLQSAAVYRHCKCYFLTLSTICT